MINSLTIKNPGFVAILNASPGGSIPTPIVKFMADSLTGLSDGDPVSTWVNEGSSGSGNDITAADSERPVYKTGILNGLPTVRFDGSNDILGSASDVVFSTGCSIFVVSKNRIMKSDNGVMRIGDDITNASKMELNWDSASGSGNFYFVTNRNTSITYIAKYSAGPSVNSFFISCCENTGSALHQYINNSELGVDESFGSTFTLQDGKLWLGISRPTGCYMDGDIAEFRIYSPALTAGERAAEFAILNAKYAIY